MLEEVGVEARAELLVEDTEEVFVELGRDPPGVVVGGLQNRSVFYEVHTDEEVIALPQVGEQLAEVIPAVLRAAVADGAAQLDPEPPAFACVPG